MVIGICLVRFCAEAMERGQIVVCAMHPKAREVFDSLGMSYLMIYPNENERDRYFTIYDTRPDEREWIELNKSTWDTKIDSIRNAKSLRIVLRTKSQQA